MPTALRGHVERDAGYGSSCPRKAVGMAPALNTLSWVLGALRSEDDRMPSILSCSCGARLRVPEGSSGKLFRCPRCKGDVAAPAEQAMRFTPAAPGATA